MSEAFPLEKISEEASVVSHDSLLDAFESRDHQHVFETNLTEAYTYAHEVAERVTRSPEEADEVAQRALIRTWVSKSKAKQHFPPKTFIYGIVYNCAVEYAQVNAKYRRRNTSLDDPSPSTRPLNDKDIGVDEINDMVDIRSENWEDSVLSNLGVEGLFGVLSPREREIIDLHGLWGADHEKIGQFLGINETASRVRLFRARQHLQKLISFSRWT